MPESEQGLDTWHYSIIPIFPSACPHWLEASQKGPLWRHLDVTAPRQTGSPNPAPACRPWQGFPGRCCHLGAGAKNTGPIDWRYRLPSRFKQIVLIIYRFASGYCIYMHWWQVGMVGSRIHPHAYIFWAEFEHKARFFNGIEAGTNPTACAVATYFIRFAGWGSVVMTSKSSRMHLFHIYTSLLPQCLLQKDA